MRYTIAFDLALPRAALMSRWKKCRLDCAWTAPGLLRGFGVSCRLLRTGHSTIIQLHTYITYFCTYSVLLDTYSGANRQQSMIRGNNFNFPFSLSSRVGLGEDRKPFEKNEPKKKKKKRNPKRNPLSTRSIRAGFRPATAVRCAHAKTASSEVVRVSWRVMAQGRGS